MIKSTEIILQETELTTETHIVTVDDVLDLKVGDPFYFAHRGTSPRSEEKCYKENTEFNSDFIKEFIDYINKKSDEYHIKSYEVVQVGNSLTKDYSFSIVNPKVSFVRSITVKEV